MKLDELIPGKKYKFAGLHIAELIAKEGNDVYFNIEGEHNYLIEPSYSNYPGTVGIKYQEELVTEL